MMARFVTIWIFWLILAGQGFAQNPYYDHGSFPAPGTIGSSAAMRAELDLIEAGFGKLPSLAGNANKVVIINGSGTALTATDAPIPSGTAFPSSPSTNALFLILDDVAAGDCDSLGGVKASLCRWNGATWEPVVGVSVTTLDQAFDGGKIVDGANSLPNALCVGDGITPLCFYTDPTLGPVIRPQTDADTRTYIWANKTWGVYDIESTKYVLTVDPDAFATGSGTLTLATSEQLVASNLGVEFAESDTNPACGSGNYTIYADTSEATLKYCNNGTIYTPAQEITIRKTADETVTASVTLQDDDDFFFTAAANTTYAIKIFALYQSSTTADFQYTFALPAGATGVKASTSAHITTTACTGTTAAMVHNNITVINNNVGGAGNGAGNTCALVIDATITTAGTSGLVAWRWAQAVSDATNTVVAANSWMSYRRIP